MISVIIPYIRPERIERLRTLAEDNAGVEVEILTEFDKDRIGCPKMVKRLTDRARFDLVCFIGDDTTPLKDYLLRAVEAMNTLPDSWGLVGLNDCTGRNLPTHWLAHKKLLDHLEDGEFFHTGYAHCFCDNELMDRARELERFVYCKRSIVIHHNPCLTKESTDDKDYIRVYSDEVTSKDKALYISRKNV